ncbi:MAG: helix-turn-helix domain-containing protein [Cyanobacteria bacterium RM1_2_2]|nr:helix-turn-helix domain-containing protein [Cyanobacteria bacterium RM1_2_2]
MVGVSRVMIQETVEELKALMHQQHQVGDKERIQLLYLLQSKQARSVSHAAEILGRGRVTLQRWLAKYESKGITGLLHREPHLGQECHIPEAAQAALKARLATPEGFESYRAIQNWLEQEYNHEMSYTGVHGYVRYRLKAKLKRPRPVSAEQDPQTVAFLKRFSGGNY